MSLGAAIPELVWETTGFVAPESVVFDHDRKQFYVSNMGSWGEGSTPGDGFLSRVSAEGRILDLKWVVGLDSPKGLALANGRLYVGDEADLVEIDPASGRVIARHAPADGPGGFNDYTADPTGLGDQRIGNIDGIEPDGRGGYTVTDWVTGELRHVSADGTPTTLITLRRGAADHHYVREQRLLVVPLVLDNAIRAYRWAP